MPGKAQDDDLVMNLVEGALLYRQMQTQQIRQRRIGPVEIHARRIRREQSRLVGRSDCTVLHAWLHF